MLRLVDVACAVDCCASCGVGPASGSSRYNLRALTSHSTSEFLLVSAARILPSGLNAIVDKRRVRRAARIAGERADDVCWVGAVCWVAVASLIIDCGTESGVAKRQAFFMSERSTYLLLSLEAIFIPSGLKAKATIEPLCPVSFISDSPQILGSFSLVSHNTTLLSLLPEANSSPSGLKTSEITLLRSSWSAVPIGS